MLLLSLANFQVRADHSYFGLMLSYLPKKLFWCLCAARKNEVAALLLQRTAQ
jgi:hypothetical protein